MKYILLFIKHACPVLLLLLLNRMAAAETVKNGGFSLSELQKMEVPVWKQTYYVNGRTIRVECMAEIPAADTLPVLTVRKMPAAQEKVCREITARFMADAKPGRGYSFRSDEYNAGIQYADPGIWNEQAGEKPGSVSQETHALTAYEWDDAYADNNPLTVRQAFETVLDTLHLVYPEADLWLMDLGLYDRLQRKQTGKPLRERGCYHMVCRQTFRGIPCLANIEEAFRNKENMPNALVWNQERGRAVADVYDTGAYCMSFMLFEETGLLSDDVRVVPFDTARKQVETLISAGVIRHVYHAGLGFVRYSNNMDQQDEFILAPAWVFWCDCYHGPEEGPINTDIPVNGARFYFEQWPYMPVVVDGSTGQLFDPMTEDYSKNVYGALY